MSDPYIGQDVLDQASEAHRQGRKLEDLAGVLKCTPEHLRRLLFLPSAKPVTQQSEEFDLWRADDLQEVL